MAADYPTTAAPTVAERLFRRVAHNPGAARTVCVSHHSTVGQLMARAVVGEGRCLCIGVTAGGLGKGHRGS